MEEPEAISDLCNTEYWSARPLWQSDLDHFAKLGISALNLATPDMVFKAGIIRAVRGAEAAGVKIGRVDIEPNTGRISIVPAGIYTNDSELDRWLKGQPQNATSA